MEPPEGHRGGKGSMRGCGVEFKGVWGIMEACPQSGQRTACGRVHCGESLCRLLGASPGLSVFEQAPQTGFPNVWGSPRVSRKGGSTAGTRSEQAETAATGECGSQRWPGSGRLQGQRDRQPSLVWVPPGVAAGCLSTVLQAWAPVALPVAAPVQPVLQPMSPGPDAISP